MESSLPRFLRFRFFMGHNTNSCITNQTIHVKCLAQSRSSIGLTRAPFREDQYFSSLHSAFAQDLVYDPARLQGAETWKRRARAGRGVVREVKVQRSEGSRRGCAPKSEERSLDFGCLSNLSRRRHKVAGTAPLPRCSFPSPAPP